MNLLHQDLNEALDREKIKEDFIKRSARLNVEAAEMNARASAMKDFQKQYTSVRVNNLALTHESAIELVKMIRSDASSLTYEDIA